MLLMNLFKTLFGEREFFGNHEQSSADTHVTANSSTQEMTVPMRFQQDVQTLKEMYGDRFLSGLCIELTLQDALSVLPRDRRRSDAYRTLQAWLSDTLNIDLVIYSRKTK